MTKSTVFDAPVQQAPPPRPTTGMRSDQVGGIFGAALAAPPAPRGNMTKSSIVGGIFSSESAYGQQGAYPEPPRSARGPKPVIDQSRSAGQASKAPKENDIFNSAPLAEVGSATGYGAINMGLAFERNGGHLFTLDIDPKMIQATRDNVATVSEALARRLLCDAAVGAEINSRAATLPEIKSNVPPGM